ncbi:MAG TPA: hypothetical protein VI424_03860 [Terriglobales bacterium]
MSEKPIKRYLFASDVDRTLSFHDSGYVLSEMLGIPVADFERLFRNTGWFRKVEPFVLYRRYPEPPSLSLRSDPGRALLVRHLAESSCSPIVASRA